MSPSNLRPHRPLHPPHPPPLDWSPGVCVTCVYMCVCVCVCLPLCVRAGTVFQRSTLSVNRRGGGSGERERGRPGDTIRKDLSGLPML